MKAYHGTSEKKWIKIQEDGYLWGIGDSYRYTYLSPDINIAINFGDVILEVDYFPTGIIGIDNFGFNPPPNQYCWQFSVFYPISIKCVKRLSLDEIALVKKNWNLNRFNENMKNLQIAYDLKYTTPVGYFK